MLEKFVGSDSLQIVFSNSHFYIFNSQISFWFFSNSVQKTLFVSKGAIKGTWSA